MKGIFISYRREDTSGFARSLYQSLENHFGAGQVFMDVEGIELGLDFVEALDKSLANCRVLLVMIGKDWATCQDDAGNRRLDDPNDFVRMEVASALQRSDVRVIPVRVRGAAMPRSNELPEDLQALTRRQALELRHDSWNADVKILIDAVEGIVGPAASQQKPSAEASPPSAAPTRTAKAGGMLTKVLAVAGAVLLVLLAIGLFVEDEQPPVAEPEPIPVQPAPEPPAVASPRPAPAARPEPAPVGAQPSDMVFDAQESLAELGYDPGPVDGLVGGKTTDAVRAFQRDHGLAADGRITSALIDALDNAVDSSPTSIGQPAAAVGLPAPSIGTSVSVNMTGVWVDQYGTRYDVTQQGSAVQFEAYDQFGSFIGGGEGRLAGRNFEYVFVGMDGTQATGQGSVSADGRQMDYQSVNLVTGAQERGAIIKQ